MGDRSCVQILNNWQDKSVYLYSHWCGSKLLENVHRALARRQRWTDDSCLTRIVFCEMLRDGYQENPASSLDDECSYGISATEPENEYKSIALDCEKQEITVGKLKSSFEEFVTAPRKMFDYYLGK